MKTLSKTITCKEIVADAFGQGLCLAVSPGPLLSFRIFLCNMIKQGEFSLLGTAVARPLSLSVDWLLLVTWLHYARRRRVESWQAVGLPKLRTGLVCVCVFFFFLQCQSRLFFNPVNVKIGYTQTHIRQRSADETVNSWKSVLWLSC